MHFQVFKNGVLPRGCSLEKNKHTNNHSITINKMKISITRIFWFHTWNRKKISIEGIHEELAHFCEKKILQKIKHYFWHNKIESIRKVVCECKECQLVQSAILRKFEVEKLHNIRMCELFYNVTLNTICQLLETNYGNKYISMVIKSILKMWGSPNYCKSQSPCYCSMASRKPQLKEENAPNVCLMTPW